MSNDMIILTRVFDLLAWQLPKSERFPKVYRHTVTARLMNAALDFQEALFDAVSQGGTTRQKHLRAADAHLNKLRLYLRLAHQWGWPERRPVPARQRHGCGDRAVARWVD
jgi:hypothetical protein